jgi:hypothetical protein
MAPIDVNALKIALSKLAGPIASTWPASDTLWVEARFATGWARLTSDIEPDPLRQALADLVDATQDPGSTDFSAAAKAIFALDVPAQKAAMALLSGFVPAEWAAGLAEQLRRFDATPRFVRISAQLATRDGHACDAYLGWLRERVGWGSAWWLEAVGEAILACRNARIEPSAGLAGLWQELLDADPDAMGAK